MREDKNGSKKLEEEEDVRTTEREKERDRERRRRKRERKRKRDGEENGKWKRKEFGTTPGHRFRTSGPRLCVSPWSPTLKRQFARATKCPIKERARVPSESVPAQQAKKKRMDIFEMIEKQS